MISHSPRKRLGQHFLHDQEIIQRIIAVIASQPGHHLVEIGPGKGALTLPLLRQGYQLEVIELDSILVQLLKQQTVNFEHFHIHHADVLKFNFNRLITAPPLRICGNLPYNLSTALLFHLLHYANNIQDMIFMLQQEIVERLVALPNTPEYGRLSVMLQYHCQMEFLFTVTPRSFYPPPQVNSAVVRLVPYENPPVKVINQQHFALLVTQAFSQRRKTLRNSLKGSLDIREIQVNGIDPQRRAETLQLFEFAKLANYFTLNK
jgi:16S rRNA (adenine1518-N6/adenine1519-N6)-dimethyltransferase